MAKSKKKLVRNFSVSALMMGVVLTGPGLETNLSAETTNEATQRAVTETWTNVGEATTKETGSKASEMIKMEGFQSQKSSLGNTRTIRTSYAVYKYDANQTMTSRETWKYNADGKPTEKFLVGYKTGGTINDYDKTYKWAVPGQGSPYLASHTTFNRSNYDMTRNYYNKDGVRTKKLVTGKNSSTQEEYTYHSNGKLKQSTVWNFQSEKERTKEVINYNTSQKRTSSTKEYMQDYDKVFKFVKKTYTNGVLTKQETTEKYADGKVKSKATCTYYTNGKAKELKTYYYNTKGVKTKFVYNSFYETGKKKVAQDTYYYENGSTKKSMKENQYNSKGVKTKYIVNEFHSNGKKKLARDTYYYGNGKTVKEKRENLYNTSGVKTKYVYNTFYSNGKKKVARDTYYYGNGKTRKELKENQYDSKGKKTKYVLNQWYSNGKPKLYKDTYYKSNGKVKEVRQTSFSKTGKKTTSIKKY